MFTNTLRYERQNVFLRFSSDIWPFVPLNISGQTFDAASLHPGAACCFHFSESRLWMAGIYLPADHVLYAKRQARPGNPRKLLALL